MSASRIVSDLVKAYIDGRHLRAGSLIITVYGDAIAPRGGTVWLGSLIKLLAPLGLNQRLVRTAMYRLSKEGWFTASQVGRRSYYSLTRSGWRTFDRAYQRVYAEPHQEWNGDWTLLLLAQVANGAREGLRRELLNLGFGAMAPGVLAHPLPPRDALSTTLQEHDPSGAAIVMHARYEGLATAPAIHDLVRECWNLDELGADYGRFLSRFRPVWRSLKAARRLDPEHCFLVRTLLIHEIRRLLLRDPQLPDDILPTDWNGAAARLLCRNLYQLTHRLADEHLSRILQTAEGPLPMPAPYFYKRFGGLSPA